MKLSVVAASTQLESIGADKDAECLDVGGDCVGQLEFTDIGQCSRLANIGNQARQEQDRIFDKERNGTQEEVMLKRCQGVKPCSQIFRSQFPLERDSGLFQNVGKFTAALVERVRRTDDAEKVARGVRGEVRTQIDRNGEHDRLFAVADIHAAVNCLEHDSGQIDGQRRIVPMGSVQHLLDITHTLVDFEITAAVGQAIGTRLASALAAASVRLIVFLKTILHALIHRGSGRLAQV